MHFAELAQQRRVGLSPGRVTGGEGAGGASTTLVVTERFHRAAAPVGVATPAEAVAGTARVGPWTS